MNDWTEGLTPDDLPGDLQLIAQECGVRIAVDIAEKLGGMKIYIMSTAAALLPAKKRWIRKHRHLPVRDLIMATRLSETTVRSLLRDIEIDARQQALPI